MRTPGGFVALCAFLCVSHLIAARAQGSTQVSPVEHGQYAEVTAAVEAELLEAVINKPLIVAIGDSITAFGSNAGGWLARLGQDYAATADVLNKGLAMGSTRSGIALVKQLTQKLFPGEATKQIKLATLCFGANDASTRRYNETYRAVPLAEYTANLLIAVNKLHEAGVESILLITPPPPTSRRIDRRLSVTAEYAAAVKQVGQQMNVPVADTFTAIQQVPDWENEALIPDGLHLNGKGNDAMYQEILRTINDKLPAVSPDAFWHRLKLSWAELGVMPSNM